MAQVTYPGKDKVVGACLGCDHCSALSGMVIREKILCALRNLFEPGTDKRKVIDFFSEEEEGAK
jgi:hypothetical protein